MRLEGPVGSGKTYILKQLADKWNALKAETAVLFLSGDLACEDRNYYPLIESLKELKGGHGAGPFVSRSLVELAKGIPIAGDFVSFLVESLATAGETRREQDIRYLNETERVLLLDIERMFKNKNLLIVIDNLQWVDKSSLRLVELILNRGLGSHFKAIEEAKFVVVVTENRPDLEHQSAEALAIKDGFPIFKINYIKQGKYMQALNKFGFEGILDREILRLLFSLTGGDLTLIKRLADYLSTHIVDDSFADLFYHGDRTKTALLETLLLYRLKEMGVLGDQIVQLLEYASVIGVSFSDEELACVSREKEDALRSILDSAKKVNLVEQTNSKKNFTHELIREFFLARLKERKFSYYSTFAECLTMLRPSDYFTRAMYLFESGNLETSITLYILGVFRNLREGMSTSSYAKARIDSFVGEYSLSDYYSLMMHAYDNFLRGKYKEAIDDLTRIEDLLPRQLLAEKYYLLSVCLTKSMDPQKLEEARKYLTDWDDLENSEAEVWIRIMSTLLTLSTGIRELGVAQAIERRIMTHLARRIKYDPDASHGLNILRRKSGSLHITEIALERTGKSVEFFSQMDESSVLLYPTQYYLSLTNHSANLIVMGDYIEAFKFAKKALDVARENDKFRFPELQIPANNYVVSGFLAGLISPTQALAMFGAVRKYEGFVADDALIKNNLAVVQIHCGDLASAHQQLENVFNSIASTPIDSYYIYFVGANLASVKHLMGKTDESMSLWSDLGDAIPDIPDKKYLETRHRLLVSAFHVVKQGDWESWDDYLATNHPHEVGRAWNFYRHGFLFSDIQLWYEA